MKRIFLLATLVFTPFFMSAQWIQLDMPTTKDILSSTFVSDNEGWIGTKNSGSYAIIFHTADGGTTWNSDTISGAAGGTSYLEFVNSNLGFAVVNGKAFKTMDAGGTWTQMTLPGTPYNEPYFLNADTGFISGIGYYEFIFKTVDGGFTWSPVYVEPGEGNPFKRINFLNDSVGIATAADETAYTTTDGGDHWNLLYFSTFQYYTSACYSKLGAQFVTGYTEQPGLGNYPWILGDEGWSDDDNNDQCYLLDIASFENSRVYAAGNCGRMVYTEDDGYKWIDTTLTSTDFTLVDGIHDIYVFGKAGKGFKRASYCAAAALFTFEANNLSVNFIDQSTSAISWSWDFGDGFTSTNQNPSHTYPVAGAYNVCLYVTSPACGSDTLCFTVIVCEANTSLSWEGSLDTTFADEGLLIDSVGNYAWYVNSLLIQPDGKILATNAGYYSAIIRYNTIGTRDSSFSDDGLIPNLDLEYGARIALAPNGKIVIGGGHDEIEIIRYNSDGSIDSSFDDDGILINDISQVSASNHIVSLAYQPDGKLLVFGIAVLKANVARFNMDGSLDLSFATDGIFNSEDLIGYQNSLFGDMILQDDGKIVIGASNAQSSSYYYLIRINASGKVDSSFGLNGVVKSNFLTTNNCWDYLYSILRQPDGKYLAIGTGTCDYEVHNYYSIARFNSDGNIDSSFAYFGRDTFQIASLSSHATGATLQADGKILIAGYYGFDPYNYKIGLLRLNEDASFDSTFGNYGIATTSFECANTEAYSIALDSDKIYIGGSPEPWQFMIARYNNTCLEVSADFSYIPDGGTIHFTNQSSNDYNWLWDFGDGTTSTLQNPIHAYTGNGTYDVCLMVGGCLLDTICQLVTVLAVSTDQVAEQNALLRIHPNPFSSSTIIAFTLEENTHTSIQLFDLAGKKINTLLDENLSAGNHEVQLSVRTPSENHEQLSGGIYFVQLKTDEGVVTKKIVIE